MDLKAAMGCLSVAITLIAYGIYLWQTARYTNIRPHPFSWLLWGVVTGVAFWIQVASGAAAGSWVMGLTSAICILIGVVSLAKERWSFSVFDWSSLTAAALVFVYYLLSRNRTLSAVLATAVDLIGYLPTIKKGWDKPHDDSVVSFSLNSGKFVPSLFAMGSYSVATCLYPASLVFMNSFVAVMLLARRRMLEDNR